MDVASGMAFLHSANILHGDLKIGNILLKSTTNDVRGAPTALLSLPTHPSSALQSWAQMSRRGLAILCTKVHHVCASMSYSSRLDDAVQCGHV